MKPSIIVATVIFGLLVAAIIFCLGHVLLNLGLVRAIVISLVLGAAQAGGSLFYVYRRFKYQGQPPRNGGNPG